MAGQGPSASTDVDVRLLVAAGILGASILAGAIVGELSRLDLVWGALAGFLFGLALVLTAKLASMRWE